MAADFGLVAHSAQRHAHELAPRRLGDRHTQRRLADSRRPHKAQDRALGILHQLAHREKLQDALLDLLQPVMIFVQYLFSAIDVADFLRPLLPRHGQQPIQVVARDGGLGRHRRHGFHLLQLLHRLVFHVLGHSGGVDLLLQLVPFAFFAASQFLLDGLDLLVQVVLFLRALHLPLHPRLDGAVHVQLLDFDLQHVGNAVQALGGIEDFQ
jgi:hypothetical protein